MGNILIKCRSPRKQDARNGDDGEDIHDGALINNNNDNYFTKENFDEIIKKFPEFKDWSDQNTWSVARSRTKQRKIKWKEGEAIGNGSFGRVIMGLNLQKGDMMAVKQVQIGASNTPAQQERIKALEVEIDLLSHLSHKNIVRYFGSHRTKTTFNIFLEYVSGGTIASLIEKYGPLNENLVRVYTKQILEGLEYLHVQNTVHRDIKGANVLVNNAGVCKLADFGTAKRISSIADNEAKFMPSIRGTVNWMAPEVIKQSSLGRSSDIWSVGCTVLEMLTGKVPWYHLMKAGSTQISAMYQIATAKTHPPLPEGLSPEAVDFLKQCFKINPAERSNVIKLLKHKFIVGHDPQGKIQTPSQKSKKTIFGSLKCTEMTEKSEVHKKEKEKEHEKANSKQRPSFLKYIPTSHKSEDEVETISSSTLADKIAKEKKESKEAISNGGIGSKKIEEEKQIDVTKKPKFVIKSDPQTNSINLDQLNRDDKSVRTVSSPPIEEIVHYTKNSMDESNHYHKEDDKIHKPQKSAFQRERGISPDQSPTYKEENEDSKPVLSQKSPKIRPLGRTRRSSVLDDHNISGNGSIIISRKTSDAVNPTEPNSQRSRRQSLFNAKDGNNKSDKDVLADKNNIIKEFAEEEARSSARMKRLSLKHNEGDDKHSEKETQSPGGTLKESKLSDSDCELSQQYQHQSRVSNSIQTVYVPENHRTDRTGESSVYQKRIHALKNSLSKKAKVDFGGIKMTESVVVPKKHESKGSMDAFNKDQAGSEQYYMNTGLYMNKKTLISPKQKRSQNIESLMLGESINPPDKFGKHVTNNLMDTRREGEMMTSIAITLQRPDTGVLDPSYVIGKEGLEHDGLHMPYLQQEHVK